MIELLFDSIETPIGTVLLGVHEGKLCVVEFSDYDSRMDRLLAARFGSFTIKNTPDPSGITTQVRAYFSGDLGAIAAIPVETGGTAYQQTVWKALREIPLGTVTSYGALAKKIGSVARAVGNTNSLNPVGIVVPCHRVIGADGTLTGYAGGLHRKEWLLRHERVDLEALLPKSARKATLAAKSHVQTALFTDNR